MPRADDLCGFEIENNPVPTPSNPLGVKGAGEGGTVGALPAVVNAVVDALSGFGVRHLDPPLTPETVWRAMKGSGARA
jgi:carbon-monoxide dehydrogenase large subunit